MSQNIRAVPGDSDLERCRVWLGEHVSLVDPGESLDGGTVEPNAFGEGALELGRRDRHRLQEAEHVREPQPHEADVALLKGAQHELGLFIHRVILSASRYFGIAPRRTTGA
jgi:hypothetical protein